MAADTASSAPDEEGDVQNFTPDEAGFEDTDDGGAIVKISDQLEEEEVGEFYANIADDFPDSVLDALASDLLDSISRDQKSRERRDKQYEEAIRRTGLGGEAPGGADFQGASRVVHPMLTEACVDFAARAVKELLPPNGPVRVFVPGKTPEVARLEKADRKKEYMNWQFLVQMQDFRSQFEQLLTQLPLSGSQYMRLVYDARLKRPVPTYIPEDDVYLPYSASNFYSAERATLAEHITSLEFTRRVTSGMYRDIGPLVRPQIPEKTKAGAAAEKVEGKDQGDTYNEDGLRTVFEVSVYTEDLEEDYGLAPYRISIDEATRKVCAIVRNWEEEDEAKEAMAWIIEFPFIPWRGAYSIGLGQMIGQLSGAATGALRALLDSAHVNNLPTLLRLKGANFSGQSKELNIGQITEVEGGVAGDDIRKLLMAVPYNPPSEVLYQLLGFLVDAGTGLIRNNIQELAEQNPEMPVGTTLALIEDGAKVMSAIHLRLFHAMGMLLRVLNRINRMYLTTDEVVNDIGEVLAQRSDFELPLDVVPVADPEIFSDVQRLAQLQIIAERAQLMPQIYNQRNVEKRILERTKIPNSEELLVPAQTAEPMNAVNENAAMVMQRPVAAFPEQDHLAHLQVHLNFLESPFLGMFPLMAGKFIAPCLDHIKEHITLWYVSEVYEILKSEMGLTDVTIKGVLGHQDPETRSELDKTLAAISPQVTQEASQKFSKLPPVIQQAQQMLAQFQQQQQQIPTDPNAMAAIASNERIAASKDQTTQQIAQGKQQIDQASLALKQQENQANNQTKLQTTQLNLVGQREKLQADKEREFLRLNAGERQKASDLASKVAQQASEHAARLKELMGTEAGEDRRTAAELQSKEAINTADNQTAMAIAAAEIESGEKVRLSTGTGINPSGEKK